MVYMIAKMTSQQKSLHGLVVFDLILLAVWLSPLNISNQLVNTTLFLMVLLSGHVLVFLSRISIPWKIVTLVLLTIVVFLPAFFTTLNLVSLVQTGKNPSNVKLHSTALVDSTLTVYAPNCGATCPHRVVIVREWPTPIPGVVYTKSIAGYDHVRDIQFTHIGDNRVKIVSLDATDRVTPPPPRIGDVWDLDVPSTF